MTESLLERRHVLFLCTANSARSQMAEAFLRKMAGDRFTVHSAGLEPTSVHPLAIQVMEEIGIPMQRQHAKPLSDFLGKVPIRFAIIVCSNAEKACPKLWPFGATVLSWPFEDPAIVSGTIDDRLIRFRVVRDSIESRIRQWLSNAE